MVIFVLKSPQFSMNFHDNLKNKNRKIDFSFGVYISLLGTGPKLVHNSSSSFIRASASNFGVTNPFSRSYTATLTETDFHLLPNWVEHRPENLPRDCEPNGIPFGSQSKGKPPTRPTSPTWKEPDIFMSSWWNKFHWLNIIRFFHNDDEKCDSKGLKIYKEVAALKLKW